MDPRLTEVAQDPVRFIKLLWPDIELYNKQREILYSIRDNDETFVPAGNMLGKDFTAGLAVLWFFLTREPCRVVTTSADYNQLEAVLWGEIRRFVSSSAIPLNADKGGPLIINHLHIRRLTGGKTVRSTSGSMIYSGGRMCGLSYVIGRTAAKGEGMLGHHIAELGDGVPRTLFVADEASGVEDVSYERADTWARRKLVLGNPYPCSNFFYKGVKAGDLIARDESDYKT